jgi:hypothetical protein
VEIQHGIAGTVNRHRAISESSGRAAL